MILKEINMKLKKIPKMTQKSNWYELNHNIKISVSLSKLEKIIKILYIKLFKQYK